MSRVSFAIMGLVALAACSETGLSDKEEPAPQEQPNIQVDPPALTFGELSDGETEVQTFVVSNVGAAGLEVSDILIGSGIAFEILGPEFDFTLASGEEQEVDVEFRPMGADENYGAAIVVSNDPDTPEAPVDLLGYGLVPELQITPPTYNFEDAFVPCGSEVELELKNVGDIDLVIESFDYTSGGLLDVVDPGSLASQLPLTLAPGEYTTLWVAFSPTEAGSDTGLLEVVSNDPRGVVTADQNGEGAYLASNTEEFTTPGTPPVDIIITIDQSCSMESDNVTPVEDGFPGFVAELQNVADWNLLLVTGTDGCGTGGIIDGNTPNAENLLVNNAFPGIGIGDPNYSLTESLLELTDKALSKTGVGGCNEGFLRPGALLHAITLSDEREQSGQSGSYWVSQLSNYVTDPNLLKISGVLDIYTNCGDGSGASGYQQAITETGGVALNICNANWGAQFTDIASAILEGLNTYNLESTAAASSIEVTVNGVPTTDFTYVEASSSVTVNDPPIGENDTVEISYNIMAECD